MEMTKPWHSKISEHINRWSKTLSAHGWWPKFVYFYTDVQNAVSIIKEGCLWSREQAVNRGLMRVDGAANDIIEQTAADHLRFVRLYYRPRTPTQYRNEGIRPIGERWRNAHQPVPVFFLFGSFEVMSRADAHFSNGNLASRSASHGPDERDFDRIEFKKVFHHGRYDPNLESDITFCRQAELMIPEKLDLDGYLRLIVCRSHAERQTLIHLLSQKDFKQWHRFIHIGDSSLFERRWAFVDKVEAEKNLIIFHMNPNATHSGNFGVRLNIRPSIGSVLELHASLNAKKPIRVPIKDNLEEIGIDLWLDDALAYSGKHYLTDIAL